MTDHARGQVFDRRAFLEQSAAAAAALALGVRTRRAAAGSPLLPSTFRPSVPPPDRLSALPPDSRLQWWRDARFGMFLHWGLYSILAGEWGGRDDYAEWIRNNAHIPLAEYDKLVARFNPVKFDAGAWAGMAKDAGMKYVTITTKHHDGFCLFDSKLTDFCVRATPFRRDIMKEMADASRRQGLHQCWYHSIMDWHHPDYLPRRDWEAETRPVGNARFARYVEHLHGQVAELLTGYGDIGVMWFDGQWEGTWTHELGRALYARCRALQPDVIVNNRVEGWSPVRITDPLGDFRTPEQEVPATGWPGVDWESCITMNRNWGYNAKDRDFKPVPKLIGLLVETASKGGNLLLNVGPRGDGTFPEESVERLKRSAPGCGSTAARSTARPPRRSRRRRSARRPSPTGSTSSSPRGAMPSCCRDSRPRSPGRSSSRTRPGRRSPLSRWRPGFGLPSPRECPTRYVPSLPANSIARLRFAHHDPLIARAHRPGDHRRHRRRPALRARFRLHPGAGEEPPLPRCAHRRRDRAEARLGAQRARRPQRLGGRGARFHGPPADGVRRGRRPGADLDLDFRGREVGGVRPRRRPWLQLGGPAAQPGIPAGGAQGADLVGAVRRRRGQAPGRRRLPDDFPEERCRRVRERQPDLGGADRRLRAGEEDDRRQRHPGRPPMVARRIAPGVRLHPGRPRLHRRLRRRRDAASLDRPHHLARRIAPLGARRQAARLRPQPRRRRLSAAPPGAAPPAVGALDRRRGDR